MRLLSALFEDENFLIDEKSIPYIVRDIVNMNWWNTCGYLLGYQNNKRVSLTYPTKVHKLFGIILKEFYRHHQNSFKKVDLLEKELKGYIEGNVKMLRQLKLFSMDYRKNDSQYFYKDGKATWLDCTSRATYAWKYVAQNGYVDFDGVVRVIDGDKLIKHCKYDTAYPYKDELLNLFAKGENQVKKEIFSQRHNQRTVAEWIEYLDIKVLDSRKWLFDLVHHVKTDPYKNNEKRLLAEGKLFGNNEVHYGYKTSASSMPKGASVDKLGRIIGNVIAEKASRESCHTLSQSASRASSVSDVSHESSASSASRASHASRASDASHASSASDASRASYVSRASRASRASDASDASNASSASHASRASDANVIGTKEIGSWFIVPTAIGELDGLDHPPVFKKNKFGIAGHWKINQELVDNCKLGWLDVFLGWGESPLYAKKHKKNFTGIEINPDSMNGYILPYIQKACDEHGNKETKINIILGDSSIYRPELENKFDLCYTSPPYFDFEDYGFHNKVVQDCFDYDEFHRRVTIPVFSNVKKYLIEGGILALQTEKDKNLKNKWINTIRSIGFVLVDDTITGQESVKYSQMSKRDQSLLIFIKRV